MPNPVAFGEFPHIRKAKERFKQDLLRNGKGKVSEREAELKAIKHALRMDKRYRKGLIKTQS